MKIEKVLGWKEDIVPRLVKPQVTVPATCKESFQQESHYTHQVHGLYIAVQYVTAQCKIVERELED